MTATSNFPFLLRAVDLIPASASAETAQNAEPSIGVDPINPTQMWAASFGAGSDQNPFFVSSDGGATCPIVGGLFQHSDTTIAWKVDGSALMVTTLAPNKPATNRGAPILTVAGLCPVIVTYSGSLLNHKPWILTGPADH